MNIYMSIMLAALLTDNFVLSRFWGICPFIGVSQKLSSSIGMGGAVVFVMVCASLFTHFAYYGILIPLELTYLRTVIFVLIIAVFVQLVEIVMKKNMPALYSALGVYLPLMTTNCAVLGVTILNTDSEYNLMQSLTNAFFAGLGFTLVLIIFAGVRKRMEESDIPNAFKGIPSTLIAASIVALSFTGFA